MQELEVSRKYQLVCKISEDLGRKRELVICLMGLSERCLRKMDIAIQKLRKVK